MDVSLNLFFKWLLVQNGALVCRVDSAYTPQSWLVFTSCFASFCFVFFYPEKVFLFALNIFPVGI